MKGNPQTYAVIGAAMEVHRELGHRFFETVYQASPAIEFQERGIPFKAEVTLPVRYKVKLLTRAYRADFVCFEDVIVEPKAVSSLTGADDAQLSNELKATGIRRGLLINFGAPGVESRRRIFGEEPPHANHSKVRPQMDTDSHRCPKSS